MLLQSSGCLDVSLQSTDLLQDFNALLSSAKRTLPRASQPNLWAGYETTISKLRSFLPSVLPNSDLIELDPQQSSLHALPSLIYSELQLQNKCTVSLHALLDLVSGCLQSRVPLTAKIGQDIACIASDIIPPSWLSCLPKPLSDMVSLTSTVKLLRARLAFYRRTLQSGTLPSKLNPLLFSNPQDLISSRACSYAAECQFSTSSVEADGTVGTVQ